MKKFVLVCGLCILAASAMARGPGGGSGAGNGSGGEGGSGGGRGGSSASSASAHSEGAGKSETGMSRGEERSAFGQATAALARAGEMNGREQSVRAHEKKQPDVPDSAPIVVAPTIPQ